jgi:hypothetical protein
VDIAPTTVELVVKEGQLAALPAALVAAATT